MANRRFIDFPIASTVGDSDIILIWQSGANKQTTKATFLSGLPENLEDLNDVVISGLTNGQILRYDSVTGKWENTDQGNLDLNDLNDVSIVSPSNGQVLVYNSSTSQWENSSGGFVPYVGAVTTVDLGAQGLRAGYVRFDTTVAGVPNEQGLMFWDADDETVDIILNGYTMKIGEDLFYPVKNQTGSTIAKGVAVRFNGTVGASGRLLIAPFIADGSVPSSRFMGVTAEEILNGEDGKVLYFGRVRGINTNAFNEGDILYASTTVAGGYQTAIPVAPNNIVQVAAVVTKSATVGTIFVRPTLGSNINKDEGVKITSVADKNLLQYQSGTSLWENKSLAQVLGGTSAQFVKGDGSLDSTTYGTGTVTSVGLSSATSGVTIGSTPVTTSGTITLAIATASGSQNGLLSSTDWTTFNSKQNALTNPVTGTGTTNYLPKFTGSTTIGNSLVFDNGTNVGIGTNNPLANLQVGNGNQSAINGAGNKIHIATTSTRSALVTLANSSGGTTVEGQFESSAESADLRVIVGSTSNHPVVFRANNSEAFRIFAAGNTHIGPTPSSDNGARLQVSGTATFGTTSNGGNVNAFVSSYGNNGLFQSFGTDGALKLQMGGLGTNEAFFYTGPSNFMTFYSGGSERMRITSGGNVLIGTTTDNGARLQVSGAATFSSSVTADSLFRSNQGVLQLFAAGGFRGGLYTYNQWAGTGTDYSPTITSESDIFFATAGSITKKMTITSGGSVLIGTTTALSPAGVTSSHSVLTLSGSQWITGFQSNASSNPYGLVIQYNNASPNTTSSQFLYLNDNVGVRAQFYSNGGLGNYQANNVNLSDERTKKDIEPLESYWDKFKAIEIVKFKYKDQTHDDFNIGVIAQQVETIAPEFVDTDGWDTKPKLNEEEPLKSIYTADLYHATIKVLQEAMAKIESMQKEIDTLKN